jgi:DNA-binding transcriptional MerR regulator
LVFTLAADGVSLVENAEELRAVELIRSLKSQGYSLRAIAAELDARKIPTKDRKANMEPHDSEEHPEPGRLRDNPAFRELAELMESIPADRRADAFTAAESTPPEGF